MTEAELTRLASPLRISRSKKLFPSNLPELNAAVEVFVIRARQSTSVSVRRHALDLVRSIEHPVLRAAIIGSGAFAHTLGRWLEQFYRTNIKGKKAPDGMFRHFLQFCAEVVPDVKTLKNDMPCDVRPEIVQFLFSSRNSPYDPVGCFHQFVEEAEKVLHALKKRSVLKKDETVILEGRVLLQAAVDRWLGAHTPAHASSQRKMRDKAKQDRIKKECAVLWKQYCLLMPASEDVTAAEFSKATSPPPSSSPPYLLDEGEDVLTPTGQQKSFSNPFCDYTDPRLGEQQYHAPAKISTNAASEHMDTDAVSSPSVGLPPTSRKRKKLVFDESKNETHLSSGTESILRLRLSTGERIRHPKFHCAALPLSLSTLPFPEFLGQITGERVSGRIDQEMRERILNGYIPFFSYFLSDLYLPEGDSVLLSALQEVQLLLVYSQSHWLPHWTLVHYHVQRIMQTSYDAHAVCDLRRVQMYWELVEDRSWDDPAVQKREMNFEHILAMTSDVGSRASSPLSSLDESECVEMEVEHAQAAVAQVKSESNVAAPPVAAVLAQDQLSAVPPIPQMLFQTTPPNNLLSTMNVLEEYDAHMAPTAYMTTTLPVATSNPAPPAFETSIPSSISDADAPKPKRTKRPVVQVGSAMMIPPPPPPPPPPATYVSSVVPTVLPAELRPPPPPPSSFVFTTPPSTAYAQRTPSPAQLHSLPPVSATSTLTMHRPPQLLTGFSPTSWTASFTSPPASPSYRSPMSSSASSGRPPQHTSDLRRSVSVETAAYDRGLFSPRSTGSGGSSSSTSGSRTAGNVGSAGGGNGSAHNLFASTGTDDNSMTDTDPSQSRSLSPQPRHDPSTVFSKPFTPHFPRAGGASQAKQIDRQVCVDYNSMRGCRLLSPDAPTPPASRETERRRCTRKHLCHFLECKTRFSQPHSAVTCPHSANAPKITLNGAGGPARY